MPTRATVRVPAILALAASVAIPAAFAAELETGAVVRSDGAAFHRNAIPQIARLGNGQMMAVWTVSPKTAGPPGRVYGAFSRDDARTWGAPQLLFSDNEKTYGDPNLVVDGHRVLVLATLVTTPNRIAKSWTMLRRSEDDGATWSEPSEVAIPRQYVTGKRHNGIVLRDGTYLVGVSWDKWPELGMAARTEGEMDLTTGVLVSKDGRTWPLMGAIHTYVDKISPFGTNGLCEPAMVELDTGEILMLLRSGDSFHYETRSRDGGITWSLPRRSSLPGHNTPVALHRLQQNPREIVAVWNASPLTRYPLSASLSGDGGKTWTTPRILAKTDSLQVSYPGLTQAADGTIVAVWQQALADGGRDIRWARFSRDWLVLGR